MTLMFAALLTGHLLVDPRPKLRRCDCRSLQMRGAYHGPPPSNASTIFVDFRNDRLDFPP
jgi:hypothetical protein